MALLHHKISKEVATVARGVQRLIGSGFLERTDPSALVMGPIGVALDSGRFILTTSHFGTNGLGKAHLAGFEAIIQNSAYEAMVAIRARRVVCGSNVIRQSSGHDCGTVSKTFASLRLPLCPRFLRQIVVGVRQSYAGRFASTTC